MIAKRKLQGILSLSAASIALSQSISLKGQQLDRSLVGSGEALNTQNTPKTSNLILAPVHHEELVRLYAGHASHASHASHSSHYSGTSGGYDNSTPSIPTTPAPTAPRSQYPTYTQPKPRPVVPAAKTNSVTQTNSPGSSTNQADVTSATNASPREVTAKTNTELIDFLKKRAAEGSPDAQYALADYYLKGRDGVKQDVEAAKLLLEMSASQGNTFAKERLEELQTGAKDSGKSDK